jgi:hypothetical protein
MRFVISTTSNGSGQFTRIWKKVVAAPAPKKRKKKHLPLASQKLMVGLQLLCQIKMTSLTPGHAKIRAVQRFRFYLSHRYLHRAASADPEGGMRIQ